jgi:low affinity Fe/Cu permease
MSETACEIAASVTAPSPASGMTEDDPPPALGTPPAPGPVRKLYLLGCRVCDFFANIAGHPLAIIVLIVACLFWLVLKGQPGQNLLTLILSILAITLTQMVLNQQRRSELALHLKIDELITSHDGARDELAGIETADEDTLRAARLVHHSE